MVDELKMLNRLPELVVSLSLPNGGDRFRLVERCDFKIRLVILMQRELRKNITMKTKLMVRLQRVSNA
jgi:hypothetical protein